VCLPCACSNLCACSNRPHSSTRFHQCLAGPESDNRNSDGHDITHQPRRHSSCHYGGPPLPTSSLPASLFLNPLASGFCALVLDEFVLHTTAEHGKARAVSTVGGTAFARGVPFDRIHPLGRFLRGILILNARQTTAFPVKLYRYVTYCASETVSLTSLLLYERYSTKRISELLRTFAGVRLRRWLSTSRRYGSRYMLTYAM
jgi:hypothetical protein